MMIFKRSIQLISCLALLFLATASLAYQVPQLDADVGYVSLDNLPSGDGINPIRLEALKEGATTLGMRGALAWRAEHIDQSLQEQATYLDKTFDFNQLLLDNNVLPPVLDESSDSLNLADPDTIRMANQTYRLLSPARFVTAPPTWRTYLWLSFRKPSIPNKALLPITQEEAQVWNAYLAKGWKLGLEQANDIFADNLSRLKRDYLGMILYRKLLDQGMITAPHVSTADFGVTGDANELRVNDRVMRITSHSALQPDSEKWTPVLTK